MKNTYTFASRVPQPFGGTAPKNAGLPAQPLVGAAPPNPGIFPADRKGGKLRKTIRSKVSKVDVASEERLQTAATPRKKHVGKGMKVSAPEVPSVFEGLACVVASGGEIA